jgi:hypothetical protein
MKGNTMAGLCDEPETPLSPEEDPERMAHEMLTKSKGGLGNPAIAQAYATLALVREMRELRREIHRFRTPPRMTGK